MKLRYVGPDHLLTYFFVEIIKSLSILIENEAYETRLILNKVQFLAIMFNI